jgi:hypothetical protein
MLKAARSLMILRRAISGTSHPDILTHCKVWVRTALSFSLSSTMAISRKTLRSC